MPFRGMARSPDAHLSARGSWKYRSTWFPLKRCTIATGRRATLTSGSACLGYRNLSEAVRTGYTELIRRMEKEYGMDQLDSYQLLNLMGEVQVGNGSSCLCKISRKVLERHRK